VTVPEPVDPALLVESAPARGKGEGCGIVGHHEDPEWIVDEILRPALANESRNDQYMESLSARARSAYVDALAGSCRGRR